MFKIQTLNDIALIGLEQFPPERYEVGSDVEMPDAILIRSHDMHTLKIPASLKIVGRAGAGLNNIPVDALTKLGIPVLNTPGANANAVRELVIAGMLLASRNIYQAWRYMSDLKDTNEIEKNKKKFVGFELMGKTLGIIGLGSVGVKVANAAVGLGMQVIGYDPTISVSRAWELSASVQQAKNVEALLEQADFISLHVPLAEDTKHMINAARLSVIKTGAVLLNFSRDEIVDEAAIISALQENKILCYVSDFPTVMLMNHPRVIHLPHLGASTKEAEENCAVMIVKEVRDFLEHGVISHSANFPSLDAPHHVEGMRLTVVNANIPNMVAQISAKLAAAGINILSFVNKSRGDIAYNIIDTNSIINQGIIDEIGRIGGVIHLRKL